MSQKMEVEIMCREMIKPASSSTPNNHKKTFHNLSFFDQIAPPLYVPLLFFYTTSQHTNAQTSSLRPKSSVLKISLSAALSCYYPLAGRIKDDVTVDCNDHGVLFLEAKTDYSLSQLLKNPQDQILKLLFPDTLCYQHSILTGPLAVQVTYFGCGGMSIGLCLCHKILDMSSVCSFIKKWASMATNKPEKETSPPEFNIASIYPPLDLPFLKQQQQPQPQSALKMNVCVSKRLLFDASNIDKLKAMVADHVPNSTRVEVVAALLYKSAISAAAKASSSVSFKPSIMYHAINLRAKICPELSGRNIGNAAGIFLVMTQADREVDLVCLVKQFRQEKARFSTCDNTKEAEALVLESLKTIGEYYFCNDGEKQVYGCSSWCRFGFYEVDFGWGKPFWVTRACWEQENGIGLMDTREGDGIEAFVTLEDKDFGVFEHDQELLSFCCINPSVLE